ncbi:hypothetical protein BG011_010210 [Mortierella polycephala]|uniref:SH3 domain-containing protein n=1 Tax=Mortierella polycephala TaxID=41804 RepID=A0A9P6PN13_9FUNG|nr:hypothetical protein BG011_010210 [Mortierella polycephala]
MPPSTTLSSHHRRHRWLPKAVLSLAVLTAATQAACVSLADSKACPSFSSFFIDNGILSRLKDFGILLQPFNNADEFDKAMLNATGFMTSPSTCTGYNASVRIPYQNTLICTLAVQEQASKGCEGYPTTTASNMCDSSCTLYQQGLTAMINTQCPDDSNSKKDLSELEAICSRVKPEEWLGLHDNGPTCINSLANEASMCGLGSVADKCTYCQTNTTAECCKDASTTCNYPTTTTTAGPSATLSGTQTATPSGDAAPLPPSSDSGLSTKAIRGIIGGSVGAILVAMVLFLFIRRSRKAPRGNGNLSRHTSNSSGRYNISSPKVQEEGFASATPAAPIPMNTLPTFTPEPMDFGAAAGAGAIAGGDESDGKQSYCQALYPYQASMADELDLTPGDIVNVQRVFDDGWAVGVNMNTSSEGAFPVVCVMFVDESALDDEYEDENMHSMQAMTLREEDHEGRHSPSGRNSPRSSLPSRSSSPVHLPRRNSSIRESTVIVPGNNGMASSPLAGGRETPTGAGRDTMLSDASSMNRWWAGEGRK